MQVVGPSQIPPYGPSCGSTNHDLWYIGAFDPVKKELIYDEQLINMKQ